MKPTKHLFATAVTGLALFSISVLGGCKKDDDEEDPLPVDAPTLSIDGTDNALLGPGETADVSLIFNGFGAAANLVVTLNGGVLEIIPVDPSATNYTYTTPEVADDAVEGSELAYGFALENTAGASSPEATFTVDVAIYETITLGSTDVYEVPIPEGGLLPSGTSVTLAEGRSYYIGGSVYFGEGTSLTIEPGVTIYLNAASDVAVEVEAQLGSTVNVSGTATSPIVMTSSNVLTTGSPESGDWDRFRLNATTNAVLRYVRSEYADNGFRLNGLDNSNTVEYLQAYLSAAEGFYITDGSAHFRNLINTKSGDTGYRIGDAYNGTMQFIIAQVEDHDETDFYLRESAQLIAANLTLLGPGQDAAEGGDVFEIGSEANLFKIYNSIIAESVDEDLKLEPINVTDLNGDYVWAYSYVFNNVDPIKDDAIDFFGTFDESGNPLTNPFFNNALTGGDSPDAFTFEVIPGIGVDDFVPDAAVTAKENFDPATLNAAFESANYVGAVRDAASDWTLGWVKNVDGTIR